MISKFSSKLRRAIPSKHFFKCGCTRFGSLVSERISNISSFDKKKNLHKRVREREREGEGEGEGEGGGGRGEGGRGEEKGERSKYCHYHTLCILKIQVEVHIRTYLGK